MAARTHGLAYRIWNQTRLAMAVDSNLQIYESLRENLARGYWPNGINGVLSATHHALFQTIIVHLDMIKARQGVSLYRLIQEAQDGGSIDQATADSLRQEIDRHSSVLSNIGRQRNNLIAHRSESLTFKEVNDAFPVTSAELVALSKTYYSVAVQLHYKVPFNRPWQLLDHTAGLSELKTALEPLRLPQ